MVAMNNRSNEAVHFDKNSQTIGHDDKAEFVSNDHNHKEDEAILFRKEAIDHQRSQAWGSVVIATPWKFSLLALLSIAVLIVLVVYISFAEYSRKHRVKGYIAPAGGVVKIYADQTGQFSEIHVSEQQRVTKGMPLVSVVKQLADGKKNDIYKNRLQEIDYQIQALKENIEYAKRNNEIEIERREQLIQQTQAEILLMQTQVENQLSRVVIAKNKYRRMQGLGKKHMVAKTAVENAFDDYLVQTDLSQQIEQQLLNRESTLNQQKAGKERDQIQSMELKNQLASQLSLLRERRLEVEGSRSFTITAPTDGYVTGIQATLGASVSPNIPLLSIVPNEKIYQAFLYLPTAVMGSVAEKQAVRLKFDAFPYQRFGFYEAVVKEISHTIYTPNELDIPISVNTPVYRVIATIQQSSITPINGQSQPQALHDVNTGNLKHDQIRLQPGMTLSADILYDKRTLLEWIFEPLYKLRHG